MIEISVMKTSVVFRLASALAIVLLAGGSAIAAPQLKTQAESIANGELKAKVLAGSVGVPAPSPQSRRYTMTRNGESKKVKFYVPADLWRRRAFVGEWKDKKGNVMRLARVKSLVPSFEREDWYEDEIEKGLDELESSFKGDDDDLEKWKSAWGGRGVGRFVTVARTEARYWVEFEFAENVKDADAQKLFKAFERSISMSSVGGGNISSMKWWESENDMYKFMTDLDRSKGGKFIKDSMRIMDSMRKAYEKYVPPQKSIGKCTVRVFRSMAGYQEYLSGNGTGMEWSCGLWDPSREELLIVAEDREQAHKTMRHEAFHQYLFYATERGNHATWFNEGHACFFENVRYNPAKNTVLINDEGTRPQWVAKHATEVAYAITKVIGLSYEQFYSGSRDDISLNYATSWAIAYFLEKGAYVSEEFAPYRKICEKYLELTKSGMDSIEASRSAWKLVEGRDVAADFLKFWTKMRKRALTAR